jgi:hypothetical protein
MMENSRNPTKSPAGEPQLLHELAPIGKKANQELWNFLAS